MKAKGSDKPALIRRRAALKDAHKAWFEGLQAPAMHRNSLRWQEARKKRQRDLEHEAMLLVSTLMEEHPDETSRLLIALVNSLIEPRYDLTDKGRAYIKGKKS